MLPRSNSFSHFSSCYSFLSYRLIVIELQKLSHEKISLCLMNLTTALCLVGVYNLYRGWLGPVASSTFLLCTLETCIDLLVVYLSMLCACLYTFVFELSIYILNNASLGG